MGTISEHSRRPDFYIGAHAAGGGAFTVSPDRRRVLASLLDHAGSDIKLLENFRQVGRHLEPETDE